MRDLHWQPSECDSADIRKKDVALAISRADARVQNSLFKDDEWLKSEREKDPSFQRRQVAPPPGYDSAEELSVPMDKWTPDFFAQINEGKVPSTRNEEEMVDARTLALQRSMDQLFEPGGLFDEGVVEEES